MQTEATIPRKAAQNEHEKNDARKYVDIPFPLNNGQKLKGKILCTWKILEIYGKKYIRLFTWGTGLRV